MLMGVRVARFLAGAVACFLLMTGAFLFWQGRAEEAPALPPAPPARMASGGVLQPSIPAAPEASPKSREEKRFSRADKDKNGRIEREELMAPRQGVREARYERQRNAFVRRMGGEDRR